MGAELHIYLTILTSVVTGPGRRCRYITAALNLILDELTQIGALCFV